MRTLGYDKPAFLGQDAMFVVTDAQIRYRSPALLDDTLQATASVTAVGAATLVFAQRVSRASEVLVEGEVTIALVSSSTRKPRRLPRTLRQQLAVQG